MRDSVGTCANSIRQCAIAKVVQEVMARGQCGVRKGTMWGQFGDGMGMTWKWHVKGVGTV